MNNENIYSSDLFQSTVMSKSYYQVLQDSNLIESQVLQPVYQMATSQYMTPSIYKPKKMELFHQLDDEHDSEDEGIEDYKIGGYHPVHVGEVLQNRYVIIQKLGWGHFSTVWLCKDFKFDTYVAIKVQKSAENYLEAAYDEVEILQKVAQNVTNQKWLEKLKQYKPNQRLNRDDSHVVQLLNSFVYRGPYGCHFCMVFEILGVNLLEIIKRFEYKGVPMKLCRKIAKEVLIGLDFLHEQCGVIHTDLKPENVLLQLSQEEIKDIIENGQLTSNQIFKERLEFYHQLFDIKIEETVKIEDNLQLIKTESIKTTERINSDQQQQQQLTKNQLRNLQRRQKKKQQKLQKQQDIKENQQISENTEEIIYQHQNQQENHKVTNNNLFQINKKSLFKQIQKNDFSVKVADLGNACWTHHQFSTLIQTRQYRSPEVLIGTRYNATADLWSFACMLFELLTGDFLFEPRKGANFSKNDDHLAQIQELTGKFPLQFSQRGLKSKRYFNKEGNLLRIPILNCWSLTNVLIEKYKYIPKEAKELASFLEPMLNPYPEKRATASQSLNHSWLKSESEGVKMNEQQYKEYKDKRGLVEFKKEVESEEEYADRSESPRVILPLCTRRQNYIKPRFVDRKEIDRSFTDLGYIGFGDGIEIDLLDSTGNWQFVN
ncbi:unnamed protein product [Paramecium primaurelia]|uniref:non-specific serine/threonine protein kinase n=1 Tax=Paramecium primaurelia TaxID=5886 RepID=A0A8S1PHX6_PARPR|nr:unnamed protein product [Paramecium primaurelia]